MSVRRERWVWCCAAVWLLAGMSPDSFGEAGTQAAPAVVKQKEVSLEEYRGHLRSAMDLVDGCARKRDLAACDPLGVGPDDLVPLRGGSGRRLVRYGWLRVLLYRAADPDVAAPGKAGDEPTTSVLLLAAKARLAVDLEQANAAATEPKSFAHERATMVQVLEGRDFRNLQPQTGTEYWKEKAAAWLNHVFQRAALLRTASAWVGRAVVGLFLLAVCAGLGWALVQLERRRRLRGTPEGGAPAEEIAVERDWERWLAESRRAAAEGAWRQGIHAAYWAAIARLESRRLWPLDRAKTPREVLALVDARDPELHGLAVLTDAFERTWYGGRIAGAAEFAQAEALAVALIGGYAGQERQRGGGR